MKPVWRPTLTAMALVLSAPLPLAAQTGEEVLKTVCSACHVTNPDGKIERIDAVRKTPEAWDMTVVRMMRNHGVELTPEMRTEVVAYLSDTRGLSVAETEAYRYILEKEPVAEDAGPDQLMTETCSRCHSYARVALQRRTPEDWERLINFHLGQFPTLEYQALARDRDWWGIAQEQIIPYLAATYPRGDAPAPFAGDLSGSYVLAGHRPGRGDYSGTMQLTKEAEGYAATMTLIYADGEETWTGRGVVRGAGEWRAAFTAGDTVIHQVMALKDGRLSGRWFVADEDATGGRITALVTTAAPEILAISPAAIPTGPATEVTLVGTGLAGAPVLPEGLVAEVISESPEKVVLSVTGAAEGAFTLGLGESAAPVALAVYDAVDRITVVPEVAISRVGGNGGPIPKVPAQFEAMGWTDGPDGTPGTEDDLALGPVAATWAVTDWNEAAAAMEDAKYAGSIDAAGLFTPAGAGPNPERVMGTNNTGDLRVSATHGELTAEAHLYATVQRFVDTPIR